MSVPEGTERAPVDGGATRPSDDGLVWRRVHPVTALVRGWTVIAALGFIAVQQSFDDVVSGNVPVGLRYLGPLLIGIAVVAVVAGVYSWLAWRRTAYAVDDDSVHLRTGILFRQQRRARLDRLQAVDVVQPLLARIFGLGELKLEVAGGADSAIKIGLLRMSDTEVLRNELLALAAGVKRSRAGGRAPTDLRQRDHGLAVDGARPSDAAPDAATNVAPDGTSGEPSDLAPDGVRELGAPAGPGGAPAPARAGDVATPGSGHPGTLDADDEPFAAAPEQHVLDVPVGRLVASVVRSGATVAMLVFVVAVVSFVVPSPGRQDIGIAVGLLPGFLGLGGYLFSQFSRGFGFRSAISPDGIRLRHGLLEARAQTIPPGRVQAVRLSQNLLWRDRDWWRVEVNVAGYGPTADGGHSSSLLLPVGTRQDAITSLWLVLPDLGVEDPLGFLDQALVGTGPATGSGAGAGAGTPTDLGSDAGSGIGSDAADPDRSAGPAHGFVTSPRRAGWLDPWSWRRNGFAATGRALVLRSGRFRRVVDVVPHERTQSLGLEQGPWQRRLGLASMVVHSTPGPVSPRAHHLDALVAADLVDAQSVRAHDARAAAGPEAWLSGPPAEPGTEAR
ncbi:hypothetical protein GCM10025865_19050 [Paraoerskovia sediminicola]|uniref:YdbS-like PH domain-containing protein n=1 Tax=Paraoerskovia sediminicola TaxID=1138587 RepID=A0ABM8G390_9CELL|nr:PH domain-containing protein [Paraoerskovia sediminicola]BDZ42606.1 hypothetical protein GCM10025865_19050 [Paraoerskovia sediminicola]